MVLTWADGCESNTITSPRYAATCSKPLVVTSFMTLTNQRGDALLPCGITSNSYRPELECETPCVEPRICAWLSDGTTAPGRRMRNTSFPKITQDLIHTRDRQLTGSADQLSFL